MDIFYPRVGFGAVYTMLSNICHRMGQSVITANIKTRKGFLQHGIFAKNIKSIYAMWGSFYTAQGLVWFKPDSCLNFRCFDYCKHLFHTGKSFSALGLPIPSLSQKNKIAFVSLAPQKETYMEFLSMQNWKSAVTCILEHYLRNRLSPSPALFHLPKSRLIECIIIRLIVLFLSNAQLLKCKNGVWLKDQ